jgi:glycosyltransferase involved in cell wall biosynthesis
MRVLSFSLDPNMLDSDSTTAKRVVGYGERVIKYTVVIPTKELKCVTLSPQVDVYGTGGSNKLIQLVKLWLLASKLIRQNGYDVISTQDPYFLGLVGYILAKRYNLGYEIQILGLYNLNFIRVALARWLLPKAGSMRVLSDGLKKRLLSSEFGMKSADRMHVVPIYAEVSTLGFDEASLTPTAREEFIKNNQIFQEQYKGRVNFLTVGRLIKVKNHPLQFSAIANLKDEFPNILLHVVGDGEELINLKQLVQDLGIENNVIFHGAKYHAELGTFFTQSDCFILSSDSEGWGMVVIEAATAGLPIVMTDVGCAGSAIINEESGLIVPVGDEEEMTKALKRILNDSSLRESLHKGSLQAIKTIATFDEIANGCVASWQMAVKNKV